MFVLQRRAAADGMSVPELLKREATRLASQPSMHEWLEEIRNGPRLDTTSTSEDVIGILDECRGHWPRAGADR